MSAYIVTGRHRTGTSMLMAALGISGVPVVKSLSVEAIIRAREVDPANYDPNPNGYFVAPSTANPADYPDTAIKIPLYRWTEIPEVEGVRHQVLLTTRDMDEVKQSFMRSFGADLADSWMLQAWDEGEAALLARKDVDITVVDFATMIADPVGEFKRIAELGWPLDPYLAAAVVDTALYRNKGAK